MNFTLKIYYWLPVSQSKGGIGNLRNLSNHFFTRGI